MEYENNLMPDYSGDPLFCTMSDTLELLGSRINGVSAIDIWKHANQALARLCASERPERLVQSCFSQLSSDTGSDDISSLAMFCVLYMIESDDTLRVRMEECAKVLCAILSHNPLLEFLFFEQRKMETFEEQSGTPVPVDTYSSSMDEVHYLKEPSDQFALLPPRLQCLVGDVSKFPEFCRIIRGQMLPWVKSETGCAQMWRDVLEVGIESGYLMNTCKVRLFAELLHHICPEAGEAKQLDQNMQKRVQMQKNLDAVRSRFNMK